MAFVRKLISVHKRYMKEGLGLTAAILLLTAVRDPEALGVMAIASPLLFSFTVLFLAALIPVLEDNDAHRRRDMNGSSAGQPPKS